MHTVEKKLAYLTCRLCIFMPFIAACDPQSCQYGTFFVVELKNQVLLSIRGAVVAKVYTVIIVSVCLRMACKFVAFVFIF